MTNRAMKAFFIIVQLAALVNLRLVQSLSCLPTIDRRQFVAGSSLAIVSTACPAGAADEEIAPLLDAKTIEWNGPSWTAVRYRSSTLQQSPSKVVRSNPIFYPTWVEGYHKINYKFKGASFPQGRKILTLRTPGAGLGTCLLLPNIGYNPTSFPIHFICDANGQVYEDLTYNIPRIFEAFWTEAKVLGVQTNDMLGNDILSNDLTRKCLVTGEGCVTPNLRPPATRVAIDFNGPTRRGGRVTQSTDLTVLESSVQSSVAGTFYTTKTISQYNVNQDLQLFYKEVTSLRRKENCAIDGKVRVAAFLPKYIRGMDANSDDVSYDDNKAVALYDYNVSLQRIDEAEAAAL